MTLEDIEKLCDAYIVSGPLVHCMPKLLAVAKAAKNLNLDYVPVGTYIEGMSELYHCIEELEKE